MGEVNTHLYAMFRALRQGRIERAEEALEEAIQRQEESSRYHRVIFSSGSQEKEIFTFDQHIQEFFSMRTGVRLFIKSYTPEKVSWLSNYWHRLAAVRASNPELPAGEIVARTRKYLISLQFEGGNLCYEVLPACAPRGTLEGVDLLRRANRELIPFTAQALQELDVPISDEAYGMKLQESLSRVSRFLPSGERRKLCSSLPARESLDELIRQGQELVPFTDLKTSNILLSDSFEDFLRGEYHFIDADKMDRQISYAHNLAHILYDPSWKLTREAREELLGEEGLLEAEREKSTRLSILYYLTRQVALLADGASQPFSFWNSIERDRFERFYALLREECAAMDRSLPAYFRLLRALPDEPPAWPQSQSIMTTPTRL